MEAKHHESIPWEWPSRDSSSFNEAPGWIPGGCDTIDLTDALHGDATVEPEASCHDLILTHFDFDLSVVDPLDYIGNIDRLGFELPSMVEASSPSGSSGTDPSVSSLESLFPSPSVALEIPYQSPPHHLEPVCSTAIGVSWCSENHAHSAYRTNEEASASEATATLPGVRPQQSSSKATTEPQAHNMKDKRPGLSARQRRRRDRPVVCPECPMSFPYQAEQKRHIAAKHRHVASKYHVSTEPHACDWCQTLFDRKDHLLRHLTRKHGRKKKATNRRSVLER